MKINEDTLKHIVSESVKRVLKEYSSDWFNKNPEGPHDEQALKDEMVFSIQNAIKAMCAAEMGIITYAEGMKEIREFYNSYLKVKEESKLSGIQINYMQCFNMAIELCEKEREEVFQFAVKSAKGYLWNWLHNIHNNYIPR